MEKVKKKINIKRLILATACTLLTVFAVLIPISTLIVYEVIFGERFEPEPWLQLSVEDFPGMKEEQVSFESSVTLSGYKYSVGNGEPKGIVVVSHGLGGGGHNELMPYIYGLASDGYYVFAYDAQGNGNSEGKDVGGFPQGVIDLDNAISYVQGVSEYKDLPILLFGYSWGAYSVGNVLNMHPEVSTAVMVAGFDESEDLLAHYPRQAVGEMTSILLPYVTLYERIKFGSEYTDISAIDGIKSTQAKILVVHSRNDETVPFECGYGKFFDEFGDKANVSYLEYEDQGHVDLLYSASAISYREGLEAEYQRYLRDNGIKHTSENKEAFMQENCDPMQYYEPNYELLAKILTHFNLN